MDNLEKNTTFWERLAEVYYRRYPMCKMKDMRFKIDYSNCHIAVSRNGGFIAFVKKSKRFIMDVTNPIKDSIRIFYQDGQPVGGPIKVDYIVYKISLERKKKRSFSLNSQMMRHLFVYYMMVVYSNLIYLPIVLLIR
jgi:hypothetical protein